MSVLIWIQTVCNGYQQVTIEAASKECGMHHSMIDRKEKERKPNGPHILDILPVISRVGNIT